MQLSKSGNVFLVLNKVAMRFDHIGVVAKTLQDGRAALESYFPNTGWTGEFSDPANGVFVQFCRDKSGVCYELVAPLGDQSPVHGALSSQHNIVNHVAYLVSDLSAEAERLRAAGAIPAGAPKSAIAYGGKRIQFFILPMRFIVEIIEAPNHRHHFAQNLQATY